MIQASFTQWKKSMAQTYPFQFNGSFEWQTYHAHTKTFKNKHTDNGVQFT